jgi:hypothetical protein
VASAARGSFSASRAALNCTINVSGLGVMLWDLLVSTTQVAVSRKRPGAAGITRRLVCSRVSTRRRFHRVAHADQRRLTSRYGVRRGQGSWGWALPASPLGPHAIGDGGH